jgi:hypothetical protein
MRGRRFTPLCIAVFAKIICLHKKQRLCGSSLKRMSVQAFGIGSRSTKTLFGAPAMHLRNSMPQYFSARVMLFIWLALWKIDLPKFTAAIESCSPQRRTLG